MDEDNKPAQPVNTPEPTPVVSPTPASGQPGLQPMATVPGGKKNKKQLIIAAVVAAVLVVAAIAYGVYAYVTNQPDYMLSKAVEQISKEEAIAAKFKLTTGTENNGTTFSGDIAAREDKAAKSAEAVIGIGSGNSRVTVTARTFPDMTYVRLGNLSNVPNLVKSIAPGQESAYDTPEFKAALERINDKWFSLTKEEVAGVAQGATSSAGNGIKTEDLQKTAEIYRNNPFFKADKVFNDETIDGVATAHFSVKIDKPTYRAFLTELKAANLETVKVTDEDINNADKDADDFAKNAAVEFWIARDSKKFKQAKFASLKEGDEMNLVVTMVTDLPTFDKLEKPTDVTPFNEFMTLFLGPSFGTGLDVDNGMTEEEFNQ